MTQKLERLQKKKRKLITTLKSLSHKEEILQLKIGKLEKTADQAAKRKTEDHSPVDQVSAKLEKIAQNLMEAKPSAKSYSGIYHQFTFPKRNATQVEEKPITLRSGLNFENRVRVQRNVVFSWSYKKLS